MFIRSRTSLTRQGEAQIERRWLRSVIAASNQPLPAFPWMCRATDKAAKREAMPVIIGDGHRRTTALFRRDAPASGLAAG